ncbi:hypothetical protein A2462_00215 [candidate division WOR-1 bacterium RIFOXYC2_FULL_41_25]|uniref:BIG2 domain-containing protein n=1 Tax=candidate division WOR-1 bacterium RIFOXYC2_FULL_41_25 TaxID=1802586 RepID=A0A1F4TIC1_UNCSA|nr:MAG: hypothetical protein A2462_00215 [candidate division WOR-1 bacterium RIFOXYC2_FULL_41_25]
MKTKLTKLILIVLGLIVFFPAVATAKSFLGPVDFTATGTSPAKASLRFLAFTNSDESHVVTEKFAYLYTVTSGQGNWQFDTGNLDLAATSFTTYFYDTGSDLMTFETYPVDDSVMPYHKSIDLQIKANVTPPVLNPPLLDNGVTSLSWTGSGAGSYKIYRSSVNNGRYRLVIDNIPGSATSIQEVSPQLLGQDDFYYLLVQVFANGLRVPSKGIKAVRLDKDFLAVDITPPPPAISLYVNQSISLEAVASYWVYPPAPASSYSTTEVVTSLVTWEALGGVGTIGATGVFTAEAAGSGYVKASYTSGNPNKILRSQTVPVEVLPIKLQSISLIPATAEIISGQTKKFNVVATYNDNSTAEVGNKSKHAPPINDYCTFEVIPIVGSNVVTVTSSGEISANKVGVIKLKAYYTFKQITKVDTATVTVEPNLLDHVIVEPGGSLYLMVGETVNLTVEGYDLNDNKINPANVSYNWQFAGGSPATATTKDIFFTAGQTGFYTQESTVTAPGIGIGNYISKVASPEMIIDDTKFIKLENLAAQALYGTADPFDVRLSYYFKPNEIISTAVTWEVKPTAGGTVEQLASSGTDRFNFIPWKKGSAEIVAYFDGLVTSEIITIDATVSAISIVPSPATIVAGQLTTLEVTLYHIEGSTSAGRTLCDWDLVGQAGWNDPVDGEIYLTQTGTDTLEVNYTSKVLGQEKITAETAVTIIHGDFAKLRINPASASMSSGDKLTLTSEATDAWDNPIDIGTVGHSWTLAGGTPLTSTDRVVTYEAGATAGQYTISLTGNLNTTSVSTTAAVQVDAVQSISIQSLNSSLVYGTGDEFDVRAVYQYASPGKVQAGVTFEVTNGIGTVITEGASSFKFNPLKSGTGNVIAYYAGKVSIEALTVTATVTAISIVPSTATIRAGELTTFEATLYYADGTFTTAGRTLCDWKLPMSPFISVSNGQVTLTTTGTGTIEASYSSKLLGQAKVITSTIFVVGVGNLNSLNIIPQNQIAQTGGTIQFTIEAFDVWNNKIDTKTLNQDWKTTGTNAITSVGTFTAGSLPGTYQITVTAEADGYSAGNSTGITVYSPVYSLNSIAILPQANKIDINHKTTTFEVWGSYAVIGQRLITTEVSWQVIPAEVGTIEALAGKFTFIPNKAGQCTVEVTHKGILKDIATVDVTIDLLAVSLEASSTTLRIGEKRKFDLIAYYNDQTSKNVSNSSDCNWQILPSWSTLASITSTGEVLAKAAGTPAPIVQVSYSYNGTGIVTKTATAILNILPPATLSSINIVPASASLIAGTARTFKVVASYSDQSTQEVAAACQWSLDPAHVGKIVSGEVLVTIVGNGKATVTATYEYKSKSTTATAALQISPAVLNSITVTSAATSVAVGGQVQFTAAGRDLYGNIVSVPPSWKTSGGSISSSGLLTAPAVKGSVSKIRVEANSGSIVGTREVTLLAGDLTTITLSSSTTEVAAGKTLIFTVAGQDSLGNPAAVDSNQCQWTVSAGKILPNGILIAPINPGQITVTASYAAGVFANQLITVVPDILSSTEVTPLNPIVLPAQQINFVAGGYDQYSNLVTLESFTYTASSQAGTYNVTRNLVDSRNNLTKIAQTSLTVQPGTLKTIIVTPAVVTIEAGGSQQFSAVGYDQYNNKISGLIFTCSSSLGNSSLIKTTGKTQAGNYTLTVSSLGVSAQAMIVVKQKLKEIYYPATVYSHNKKSSQAHLGLVPQAVDINDQPYDLTGQKITYFVTGQQYGNSIDEQGNFTGGISEGAYTVTATLTVGTQTYTASANVYVNIDSPKITLTIDGKELKAGDIIGQQPKIKIAISDGNLIKEINVSFDGVEASAATLKASALDQAEVMATYTAANDLTPGEHTILVVAKDSLGSVSSVSISGLKVYSASVISGTPMNYPNPFKPSSEQTTINYTLTKDSDIRIYIYDLARRLVYSQAYTAGVNGGKLGENEITWNGKDTFSEIVANGVYVYLITSDGKVIGSGEISVFE